ncbi:putative zn(2)-C6 fungal-type DNA-binding domain-containing protein [Septoria linicola]|nr:putative zn(2)-C6 fungal-type DNA-binding domain-containing protein [Septoria linicola]
MAEQDDRYPSPKPANGLPFYQHTPTQQPAPPPQQQEQLHSVGASHLQPNRAGDSDGPVIAATDAPHGANNGPQESPASPGGHVRDAHHPSHEGVHARPHLAPSEAHAANSASAVGTAMGGFTGWPAHHLSQGSPAMGAPPGSVAFAQANGSSDAAPPVPDKHKDKRTKVSRACDECRRKKIRCDAIDETGNVPCTNCARTAAVCAFSRQPMKRGPSKGYIKELAERLNTLEQQVQPPHMEQQHRYEIQQVQQAMTEGLQGYAHDPRLGRDPRSGEKRTHDMVDPFQNAQMTAPQAPMGHMQQSQFSANMQPPVNTSSVQPFWRYGAAHDNRRETVGLSYESEGPSTVVPGFDWDESVIEEYYRIIHQTFPLLANNKHRLRQRLAECPASLREAFLAALDCLMRTFPTTTLTPSPDYAQALKRTAELLAKYPFDNPSTHTSATNLVYLQTLILMALESDNHGPATIRGQAGPSRAEWLGRAAGVAGQLEINVIRITSQSLVEGDRDSEERLARRVWWVLFILDRWHASSTADLLKLPENSVVLLPEDQILLGESTYNLARLSFIIGHLAAILTTTKTPSTDVMAPSNPASSLLGLTLAGEIDRFRESVESVWGSLNLVHLSYHHCHLLIKRMNPTTEPSELVGHAVKVATMLNSRLTPVTPLNHHFGALAAMTLCELADVPKTRAEAAKGLDQMSECLGAGRGLAGKLESEGWDGAVRELVTRKKEAMLQNGDGLHDLANAAAGVAEHKFDPTMITRYGYLTSLGQGLFGREDLGGL